MVALSRASLGTHTLRPLNLASMLRVQSDADGAPGAVGRRQRIDQWRVVTRVQDRWRIDDEWWRDQPVARIYYLVVLDDALLLTVYHDLVVDQWFEQHAQER